MTQTVLPTLKRGWCPHLFAPMESADGFLVRIKPFPVGLNAAQLAFIGHAALTYGNALLDITQKGNIQIRGLTQETAHILAQETVEHGLASAHPLTEKRRNIMVSPLAGLDPSCQVDTLKLALDLNARLEKAHELSPLSGKFSFLVDGGGQYPLTDFTADICLRFFERQWWIGIGNTSFYTPTTSENASEHALMLARSALSLKGRALHLDDPASLFHAAHLPVFEKEFSYAHPVTPPLGVLGGMQENICGSTVAFGAFKAKTLIRLADMAEKSPQPCFRFTPWRSLLMVSSNFTLKQIEVLEELITSPHDGRVHIQTCPGAPACFRGSTEVRKDAAYLAQHVPLTETVHVSGCPKGCAYPHTAPFTLTARNGRYDFIRHGRADSIPLKKGLTLTEVMTLFSFCKELEASS